MSVLWGLLIVVAADAVAVGIMLLIRRRAPEGGYFSDSDRASGVFGVLATGFAIFAGFVIFLAFTGYDNSRSGAEQEAQSLLQQYQSVQFLPVSVRPRVTGQLICFGRSVVGQEWPDMKAGRTVETLNPWGVKLLRSMQTVMPRTAVEQSAYDRFFDQQRAREDGRRDRIHGSEGIIPISLWVVLTLLAVTLFVYVLFYADSGERARSQAMMMGSVTTALVVTLFAVYTLNRPYSTDFGGLKPVAMERSLDVLDKARVTLGETSRLPCETNGLAG
jgi:hypothetical protein